LGGVFEGVQKVQGLPAVVTAHGGFGRERTADRRPFGLTEQAAAQVLVQVLAGHTRRLALGQAGQGAGDGRGDAAGGATGTAGKTHGGRLSLMPQGRVARGVVEK
jgi:hypothetical protein